MRNLFKPFTLRARHRSIRIVGTTTFLFLQLRFSIRGHRRAEPRDPAISAFIEIKISPFVFTTVTHSLLLNRDFYSLQVGATADLGVPLSSATCMKGTRYERLSLDHVERITEHIKYINCLKLVELNNIK